MDKTITISESEQWKLHVDHAFTMSTEMIFIAVFSRETLEPIAKSGAEIVTVNKDQVRAIVNHIRLPDNLMAQIKIYNLNYFCHANASGYMIGVSNFNQDNANSSLSKVDKAMFKLIKMHYTTAQSKEGNHALHVSAFLKDTVLLFGLCKAGDESSLKILKDIDKAKDEGRTYEIQDASSCGKAGEDGGQFDKNKSTGGKQAKLILATFGKVQLPKMGGSKPEVLKGRQCKFNDTQAQEKSLGSMESAEKGVDIDEDKQRLIDDSGDNTLVQQTGSGKGKSAAKKQPDSNRRASWATQIC